jgi:hypothetical protein
LAVVFYTVYFHFQFQVSARDKGSPPLSADNPQTVTLTVIRNTQPVFTNTASYSKTIPETTGGGQIVYPTTVQNTDQDVSSNIITFIVCFTSQYHDL